MDGERYFRAAIELTDRHPGVQFREMLSHDNRVGQIERLYFVEQWRELPLMGWNTFCLQMEQAGQAKWLAKIKELDSEVMLGHLESQLLQASRDGKGTNRALLEATVKALQGLASATKIQSDAADSSGGGVSIDVKFIPSLNTPIEAEEWEKILAEKDPTLVRYFGIKGKRSSKADTLPSKSGEAAQTEGK